MSNQSRYILSKRIARGGMAEIFLGKAVGSDDFERICAIKRILPHHAQEKEFVEMFRTEAGICKRLQHANIVQVYDFKKVDSNYAIIMEFVNGTDLRSLLAACEKARVKLTVPMVVYIGAHVARGLHYAHTKVDDVSRKPLGIVHRDISPQNILISYEGEVKVIDFGIANYEAKQMETKPGVVKGKYSYMSPEQVSAKSLDARTDVFSLAIVIWEALAMKRLFAAETEVETIRNVQNCLIKSTIAESNPNVDADLMAIIGKALEKDRKNRYQSAAAFEKDLLKYLNSKFPEFNTSELGNFLKQLLATRRNEMLEDIKKLLSTPSGLVEEEGTSGTNSSKKDDTNTHTGHKPSEIHLELDPLQDHPSLSKSNSRPSSMAVNLSSLSTPKNLSSKGRELTLDQSKSNALPLMPRGSAMNELPNRGGHSRSVAPGQNRFHVPSVHHPQQTNYSGHASKKSGGRSWLTLFAGAAAICIAVGFYYSRTGVKAKKDYIEVNIKTIPDSVRLKLDGVQLEDNEYIRTPRKLRLPLGKHQIYITRDGYQPQILEVDGSRGDNLAAESIVLIRDPKTQVASVRIRVEKQPKAYIVINQGFFSGFAPTAIVDLQYGVTHEIYAYPNYPNKTNAFKCSFKPYSQSFDRPYDLTLSIDKNGKNSRCIANTR